MNCGFFELDITPCLGSVIPGSFEARISDEILDPLYVRATVFDNGEKTLAIAVIDACGITCDITERIRESVALKTDIGKNDIMVMATHAHGGGPTLTWGEEVVRDENYLDFVVKKTTDAICSAYKKIQPSELFTGSAQLNDISFIRVYKMKDGSLKTNPSPKSTDDIDCSTTEIDPELLVLAVKQQDRFVGAIVSFATHPATVATTQITGDYISILCKELKKVYGPDFVTLFINGACGNINHLNPFDSKTREKDRYITVGKAIADSVQSAIQSAKPTDDDTICTAQSVIDIKYRKPSKEYLLWAKEVFDALGDSLIDSRPKTKGYQNTFFAQQAFLIMADKNTVSKVELQLFKIANCYIAGTPAQLFVEFGKKIKKAVGKLCFVSAFANDYCGYVPVPECMKDGVYEARLCKTSCLEADAGDKIVDGIVKLKTEIFKKQH